MALKGEDDNEMGVLLFKKLVDGLWILHP